MEQSLCVYIIMYNEGKVGVKKPQSWCWFLFVNPLSSPCKTVYKGAWFRFFFFNLYKSLVESMPKIIDEKFIAWTQPSHINFLLQIGLWNLNKICQFIIQYSPPLKHDMNGKLNLCTSAVLLWGAGLAAEEREPALFSCRAGSAWAVAAQPCSSGIAGNFFSPLCGDHLYCLEDRCICTWVSTLAASKCSVSGGSWLYVGKK